MVAKSSRVDKHPDEFAEKAAEILEKRIAGEENAGRVSIPGGYAHVKFPSHLVVRSSTAGIGRGPFGEKAEHADLLVLSENEKDR